MDQLRKASKSNIVKTIDKIIYHTRKGQYVLSNLKWLKNLLISFEDKFIDQNHRSDLLQMLDELKLHQFKYNIEDSTDIDFIIASLSDY